MPTKNKLIIPGLAAILLATGCASRETAPEPEVAFGDSVRSVMNSQIYDYDAAVNPSPDAIEGSDPNRLDNVVNAYREHISKPEEIQQPIELSIGGN
jgi:hypothetical protein